MRAGGDISIAQRFYHILQDAVANNSSYSIASPVGMIVQAGKQIISKEQPNVQAQWSNGHYSIEATRKDGAHISTLRSVGVCQADGLTAN